MDANCEALPLAEPRPALAPKGPPAPDELALTAAPAPLPDAERGVVVPAAGVIAPRVGGAATLDVAVGDGVLAVHAGELKTLSSRVTAPLRANVRPCTVAPV